MLELKEKWFEVQCKNDSTQCLPRGSHILTRYEMLLFIPTKNISIVFFYLYFSFIFIGVFALWISVYRL